MSSVDIISYLKDEQKKYIIKEIKQKWVQFIETCLVNKIGSIFLHQRIINFQLLIEMKIMNFWYNKQINI